MSDLVAVAYVSSALRHLREDELERLLLAARQVNQAEQVTGVLLYDDGTFFQYIEGPAQAVERVYSRIRASKAHHGLIQLLNHPVPERNFESWSMGFTRAPKSVLLGLAQASWEAMLSDQEGRPDAGSGVKLLRKFWSNAARA